MSFFKKYKNRMIVALIAIILIIIIGMTSIERENISTVERHIGNIFTPVQKFFFNIGEYTSNFINSIKDIGTLWEENERLELEIIKLEEENRKYEDLIGRSEVLINENRLLQNTDYNLLSAQVIGKEPSNWFDRFVIDKGSNDGVKKDDIVIQAVEAEGDIIQEGIIGRVVDVGDNWSNVVSIIDENSKLSFKVIRTQDGGMLSGSIDGKLSGYLFDDKADIMKGDKLYSSSLGGTYVDNLYIGEITNVIKEDEELMTTIEVEPAIDFRKIYKVFVISN